MESCLGLIFVCMPAMAPLFRGRIFPGSRKPDGTGSQGLNHRDTIAKLRRRVEAIPDAESFHSRARMTAP